jgi:hypothetical protein
MAKDLATFEEENAAETEQLQVEKPSKPGTGVHNT